jgi:hypothetical protein
MDSKDRLLERVMFSTNHCKECCREKAEESAAGRPEIVAA